MVGAVIKLAAESSQLTLADPKQIKPSSVSQRHLLGFCPVYHDASLHGCFTVQADQFNETNGAENTVGILQQPH